MFDFFKKLIPNFDKRKLMSQCDVLQQQLDDILLPSLNTVNDIYNVNQRKQTVSPTGIKFEKDLQRAIRPQLGVLASSDYVTILLTTTTQLKSKLVILRKWVDETFAGNIDKNGINYRQLQILRMIDLGLFYVRFGLKMVDQIIYEECEIGGLAKGEKPLTPAEIKWLLKNQETFFRLCQIYTIKDIDFDKMIRATSELVVSESEELGPQGANTDPFRTNYVPVISWLAEGIGNVILQYQHKTYEANKTRLRVLQLRLQLLQQQQQEGNADPAIQRQIDYYTNLVKKLEQEINSYEKKAGVAD